MKFNHFQSFPIKDFLIMNIYIPLLNVWYVICRFFLSVEDSFVCIRSLNRLIVNILLLHYNLNLINRISIWQLQMKAIFKILHNKILLTYYSVNYVVDQCIHNALGNNYLWNLTKLHLFKMVIIVMVVLFYIIQRILWYRQ